MFLFLLNFYILLSLSIRFNCSWNLVSLWLWVALDLSFLFFFSLQISTSSSFSSSFVVKAMVNNVGKLHACIVYKTYAVEN